MKTFYALVLLVLIFGCTTSPYKAPEKIESVQQQASKHWSELTEEEKRAFIAEAQRQLGEDKKQGEEIKAVEEPQAVEEPPKQLVFGLGETVTYEGLLSVTVHNYSFSKQIVWGHEYDWQREVPSEGYEYIIVDLTIENLQTEYILNIMPGFSNTFTVQDRNDYVYKFDDDANYRLTKSWDTYKNAIPPLNKKRGLAPFQVPQGSKLKFVYDVGNTDGLTRIIVINLN